MNHKRFSERRDGFEIQDFRAEFDWKTANSISFLLCHHPAPNVTKVFGWLDVHETEEEFRRVKIRVCLHHNYLKFKNCDKVVRAVCNQLSLPCDSYDATFISPLKQTSFETECDHEFVTYGPPYEPDDNPWDDRGGVSPLEVISREQAFGMLLEAFPEFHRRVDETKRDVVSKSLGEQFLDFGETFELVDAIESALQHDDQPRLRRLFDVLEKLTVYGDDYTRNASLPRMFELLLQRDDIVHELEPFMLARTREKWSKTAAEVRKWANNCGSGESE